MLKIVVANKGTHYKRCYLLCPDCDKEHYFTIDAAEYYLIGQMPGVCRRCGRRLPAVFGIFRFKDARIRFHRKV